MASLKRKISICELVLSKSQPSLYILHHSDCESLFSDITDDEKYVKVQSVDEAKKIAKMDHKPVFSCAVCGGLFMHCNFAKKDFL